MGIPPSQAPGAGASYLGPLKNPVWGLLKARGRVRPFVEVPQRTDSPDAFLRPSEWPSLVAYCYQSIVSSNRAGWLSRQWSLAGRLCRGLVRGDDGAFPAMNDLEGRMEECPAGRAGARCSLP